MVVWSSLRSALFKNNAVVLQNVAKRGSGDHRIFPLQSTRWQWNKFKDYFHFYIFLGVIPLSLLTMYANIFIGPATLSEIPEGYVPHHWEYYRSPITRFMARYIYTNPQQEYEKLLHFVYEEEEKRRLRIIDRMVKKKMSERNDYKAYYYRPILAKYHRHSKEAADYLEMLRGQ